MLRQGGLLLPLLGAFLTTPPPAGDVFNYAAKGPYVCLIIAFGLSLGALIVGVVAAILMMLSLLRGQSERRKKRGQCVYTSGPKA